MSGGILSERSRNFVSRTSTFCTEKTTRIVPAGDPERREQRQHFGATQLQSQSSICRSRGACTTSAREAAPLLKTSATTIMSSASSKHLAAAGRKSWSAQPARHRVQDWATALRKAHASQRNLPVRQVDSNRSPDLPGRQTMASVCCAASCSAQSVAETGKHGDEKYHRSERANAVGHQSRFKPEARRFLSDGSGDLACGGSFNHQGIVNRRSQISRGDWAEQPNSSCGSTTRSSETWARQTGHDSR